VSLSAAVSSELAKRQTKTELWLIRLPRSNGRSTGRSKICPGHAPMRKSGLEKVALKGHFASELLINSFGTREERSWLAIGRERTFQPTIFRSRILILVAIPGQCTGLRPRAGTAPSSGLPAKNQPKRGLSKPSVQIFAGRCRLSRALALNIQGLSQYKNDGSSALMWVFVNELDPLINPRLDGKLRERKNRIRASQGENSHL